MKRKRKISALWATILTALGSAAVIGAADAATAALTGGVIAPKQVGAAATTGAIVGVLTLLRESPWKQEPRPKPQSKNAVE